MLRLRRLLEASRRGSREGGADAMAGAAPGALSGEAVRRRLELFARAVLDQAVQVDVAAPPPRPGWFEMVNRVVVARWRFRSVPQIRSDAHRVMLPAELPVREGESPASALGRYRFQVASHALRIARGSAAPLAALEALEERLYLIRESALAERELVRRLPRLASIAVAERRHALASRPALASLSPLDREVERFLRAVLAADPANPESLVGADDGAAGSAVWARDRAAQMVARAGPAGRLRHVEPVPGWGLVRSTEDSTRALPDLASGDDDGPADDGGAGPGPGADAPPPSPEGATPGSDAGSDVAAPSPDPSLDPLDTASRVVDEPALPTGGRRIPYPEWDHASSRLLPARVLVTESVASGGDGGWADRELADHGALVRGIRARFDRLRARRVRRRGQRDGDALDLAACVQNLVEWRRGLAGDDRLYSAVAPARRPVAITLLVDTSGSTASPVPGSATDQRVIDLEKSSVLLASEALDALGDPFAVLGFSSRGARAVHLRVIKGFDEPHGASTRARVAALEPGGNTRLGAAIRHAASLMRAQPVGHRLLLILSDGQPNDADGYVDRHAHDDSRHAVQEAGAAGVVTHCLTIDREAPEALAHIFGAAGYTLLTGAEQLPSALLGAVRGLLAR